ncbi:Predicted oxidoreductase [Jatrophihabitans endophyticus]|uniref:Predicted oxidoreductase n=1 Tax=Jatrophihabitans endophyticus TaxID=1206085 RepID=A0A1M5PWR7_9ACTN|nr:Predicted oxidoreductase [Jatrophihabitans endophyticus]
MAPRQLGRSGLWLPPLAFGTGTFAGGPDWPYGDTGVEKARRMVDRCLDAGLTLFDSADVYGNGRCQEVLGRAIEGRRDDVLVSAKVGLPTGGGPTDLGAGRARLITSCETALRRLGTDHVDLLQLHAFDARTPLEETLSALAALVASGKVRYLGASNFAAWQLMKALAVADAHGLPRFVGQQVYYSLVGRDYELELMPLGVDQGVGALVWSPLAGGWLGGDIRRSRPPAAGSRVDRLGGYGPPVDAERAYDVIDVLDDLADETGHTVAQIALNWLLQRPTVTSVIFGANTEEQLEHNLGAVGWDLTPEQVGRLDAASSTAPGYPVYMYHRDPGFTDLAPVPVRRTF